MIEKLFPREIHAALKFLGSHEWLKFDIEDGKTVIRLEDVKLTRAEMSRFSYEDLELAKIIVHKHCAGDPTTTLFVQAVGKALADGPKLFCPSTEQCMALEHTEANVTFDFYKQPYPTTIIELPTEYREHLKQEFGSSTVPTYVLAYQHTNGMLAVAAFVNREDVTINVLSPSDKYASIEDAIVKTRKADENFQIAEITQRLSLNFNLMMTMLGVKIVGPLDQEAFKRNQRHVRGGDEKKAARARKFLESTVYLCEFAQSISFFDVDHGQGKGGTHTGTGQEHRSPKPHWRRGHFRQQAYGAAMLLRKLVFIKPVLVMSKYFAGDKSDTTVTYKAKEPDV